MRIKNKFYHGFSYIVNQIMCMFVAMVYLCHRVVQKCQTWKGSNPGSNPGSSNSLAVYH